MDLVRDCLSHSSEVLALQATVVIILLLLLV